MGGAFSRPGGQITPEYVKTFLNTVLREMFQKANLVDLYSLADPERCKGYVVVAASALEKLFSKIELYPTKGKDGTFYFQKIQGIQHRNPLAEKQQSYCLELAFFFIRIFQTYAALALSIYDTELPPFDWEETRIKTRPGYVGAIVHTPPAVPGFSTGGVAGRKRFFGLFGGAQAGGALSQAPGHRSSTFYIHKPAYKPLNKFLIAPEEGEISEENLKFDGYSMLSIKQDSMYNLDMTAAVGARRTAKGDDEFKPKVIYRYKQLGEPKTFSAILEMEQEGEITRIRLKGQKPAEAGAAPGPEQVVSGQVLEDSDIKLPELIKQKMNELIVRVYGEPPFSAVEFLAEKKYIRSTEDAKVPIEGTRVVIERPKDQINAEEIEIKFYDRMTLRKQPRNIEIVAKLKLTRGVKRLPVDPTPYKAVLNWNDVRTDPRELKGMIPFPTSGYSESEFTGKSATAEPVNSKNETIPRWIQGVFDSLLKKSSDFGFVNTGIEITREGLAKPYNSEEIDAKMRIRSTWEALAKKPPIKAHCVARAVQLLNVQSIRDGKGTPLSSVCRVKFPYITDKSLPAPGGSITSEYSIHALSQLFVDKIMGSSPQITNRPEFQRFKLRLKGMFERHIDEGNAVPDTLGDITEKQMPFCRGHDNEYLKVPSDVEGALRAKARALLDRQASHIRSVMAILFKLFNRKQIDAGVFELTPEVMRGGIDTVNKIAEEARELLINYFGDCEETYKEGLFILYNKAQAVGPAALQWQAAPAPLTTALTSASGATAGATRNTDPTNPNNNEPSLP